MKSTDLSVTVHVTMPDYLYAHVGTAEAMQTLQDRIQDAIRREFPLMSGEDIHAGVLTLDRATCKERAK